MQQLRKGRNQGSAKESQSQSRNSEKSIPIPKIWDWDWDSMGVKWDWDLSADPWSQPKKFSYSLDSLQNKLSLTLWLSI